LNPSHAGAELPTQSPLLGASYGARSKVVENWNLQGSTLSASGLVGRTVLVSTEQIPSIMRNSVIQPELQRGIYE